MVYPSPPSSTRISSALFPICHGSRDPQGKSTWYFSLIRHLFIENSALSENTTISLSVLGIKRFMQRNQINFLSSLCCQSRCGKENGIIFHFFLNTLRLDEIKYIAILHPCAMLCRDTWPKSNSWQISETACGSLPGPWSRWALLAWLSGSAAFGLEIQFPKRVQSQHSSSYQALYFRL